MSGYKTILISACFFLIYKNIFCVAQIYFPDDLSPIRATSDVWRLENTQVPIETNQLHCERPYYYICEVPPDTVPFDDERICDFRNGKFYEQIYRWEAAWGCLLYMQGSLFISGSNPFFNRRMRCFYENVWAPCLEIEKEDGTCSCYPFDAGFEEVSNAIDNLLLPSAQGRWERCYYEAKKCCSEFLEDIVTHNETRCDATFDSWTCFRGAPGGTIAHELCSEFVYTNSGPTCHHFSNKKCHANGTWELDTDYTTCRIVPRLLLRYRFHIAMLSFSIVSCVPAVIIFFFYKRLRITRVALHRNLLIVIIIRNILVIITRSEIYIDELTSSGDTVLSNHGVACRVLGIAERIAANAVFICMLIEGVYLHRLIVAVFKTKLKINWLYAIGCVIAIVPVIAWAIVMGIYDNHSCWLIYTVGNIQWILDAPRLAILLINTILFIDVMRVLLTKVRNSENANQLNTAKATLFLMPIFGVQFLLMAFRPNTTKCAGEDIYYFVAYTVEGLQGFIVAMLYCYVNKEVHMLIKATYRKTESAVRSRVRGDSIYPRMSTIQNSDRRFTYSTGLSSQSMNDVQNNDYAVEPNLNVAEIISTEANEGLPNKLESVDKMIENCASEEIYSFERFDAENVSQDISSKENKVDNYGSINAHNRSTDSPDLIRDISLPCSSTRMNNNSYHHERNNIDTNSNHDKIQDNDSKKKSFVSTNSIDIASDYIPTAINNNQKSVFKTTEQDIDICGNIAKTENNKFQVSSVEHNISDDEDSENMLDEIMQYIENKDNHTLILNPELLSPNRKEEDKIMFVE